ncbi:ferrichrome ABC transporter permease [Paenibacillus sp. FSL H8-0548]|uniref:FecCD family ABC transporter permease n=1 Tax=Paenibacillus sp. FSL H8-0548 TaxID=1920422 RepID=UPI00096EF834|nr:iron ABC transporter permease [Paenibacillus sp. FSL H8-0548]OMF31773.1 ferrichrome ABC transporter permease [Paenibacillus sp. FSL H8-0548]
MSSPLKVNALEGTKLRSRPLWATIILFGGIAGLILSLALSISVGAADISLSTVWEAVFRFNSDNIQHQIIKELRMPRAVAAALVGAAFAVAGSVMQGMTRNPLADSSLLGINAGAGFMLAVCFAFFPSISYMGLMVVCFIGAAVSMGLVYGIGSLAKGGLTPVRLTLAGAAVGALLLAITEGIALYYKIGQDLAFWYAGGVAGTKWVQIQIVWPWIIGALLGALLLSRSITLLSLGDDVAAGLGQRTGLVKAAGVIIVLLLAGTAVSAVGSIGFVGLIIPHISRFLVGVDYRWIIPCSAILGSLLMVMADIGSRIVNPPQEVAIGVIIAVIGVPFFLYLVTRMKGE